MAFVVIRLIYVDFRMCRTKERCRGPKWGGLLPISSLGSRHYSHVETGGTVACTAGTLARTTENPPARAGVPGKAYRDRPP